MKMSQFIVHYSATSTRYFRKIDHFAPQWSAVHQDICVTRGTKQNPNSKYQNNNNIKSQNAGMTLPYAAFIMSLTKKWQLN